MTHGQQGPATNVCRQLEQIRPQTPPMDVRCGKEFAVKYEASVVLLPENANRRKKTRLPQQRLDALPKHARVIINVLRGRRGRNERHVVKRREQDAPVERGEVFLTGQRAVWERDGTERLGRRYMARF